MKKRIVAVLLTGMMVLSCVPMTVLAKGNTTAEAEANLIENHLKKDQKGYAGNDFKSLGDFTPMFNPENIENINPADPNADFSFWHFVDASKKAQYADITFEKGDGSLETYRVETAANGSKKYGQHYVVITPSDWKLVDGISFSTSADQFNLSHSGRHKAELGKVTVKADVNLWYNEITNHEYYTHTIQDFYERDVQDFYERDVQDFYERDVQDFYERTVQDFYERPVTDYFQRYAQKYLVPVFEKKLAGTYNETMVTWIGDNGGSAFNNSHTYVPVNVAEASTEDGVDFTIADSSPKNNPIAYTYNVKIKNGQLTVSCDGRLAYAEVGAMVWNKNEIPEKTNAPKHFTGSVTVDLPENPDDVVYLYTHFEKLGWYEVDENGNFAYQFKEWKYDDNRTTFDEDYTCINTVYGEYEFAKTETSDYTLVQTETGDYELVNTVTGDYELVKTETGDYKLVDTVTGPDVLVKEDTTSRRVDLEYTGNLVLTVDGNVMDLDTELELTPGEHTFVISASDDAFEPVEKTITITGGVNPVIDFGTIEYQLADVTLDEAVIHNDEIRLEDVKADNKLEDVKTDNKLEDVKTDNKLEDVKTDIRLEDIKADKEPHNAEYNEEYIYNEDIKLGNATDAYGEYAVRLN